MCHCHQQKEYIAPVPRNPCRNAQRTGWPALHRPETAPQTSPFQQHSETIGPGMAASVLIWKQALSGSHFVSTELKIFMREVKTLEKFCFGKGQKTS